MKAILVIDMPNDLDIPLEDIKTEITLSSKDETKSLLYLKYGRVKLKPLPDKIDEYYPCRVYDEGYYNGWNACIDEILGE